MNGRRVDGEGGGQETEGQGGQRDKGGSLRPTEKHQQGKGPGDAIHQFPIGAGACKGSAVPSHAEPDCCDPKDNRKRRLSQSRCHGMEGISRRPRPEANGVGVDADGDGYFGPLQQGMGCLTRWRPRGRRPHMACPPGRTAGRGRIRPRAPPKGRKSKGGVGRRGASGGRWLPYWVGHEEGRGEGRAAPHPQPGLEAGLRDIRLPPEIPLEEDPIGVVVLDGRHKEGVETEDSGAEALDDVGREGELLLP